VDYPTYLDGRLAYRREDFVDAGVRSDDGLEWRLAATVHLNGAYRDVCVAFSPNAGRLSLIGVLNKSRTEVVPLANFSRERIKFDSWLIGKQGISLFLLGQHMRYMERMLVRNFREAKHGSSPDETLLKHLRDDVFDGQEPPEGMSDVHVLFYCAATMTARAFFATRLYGGQANMDELVGAYDIVNGELAEEPSDQAETFLNDLKWLDELPVSKWDEQALQIQLHITIVLLTLMRLRKWTDEGEPDPGAQV